MKGKVAVIFIAILWSKISSAQSSNCRGVEALISRTADYVKENFNSRDVSTDVEQIEALVTQCNLNIARFGWGRGMFDYWKRKGYEAELATAKERVEHYSKYREVNRELETYKKYAEKLGYRVSAPSRLFESLDLRF